MEKDRLAIKMETILAIRKFNYDGTWEDLELGIPLDDISNAIEAHPEYFQDPEIKKLFDKTMKATEELAANNINDFDLLMHTFCNVRERRDPQKHYWWWFPEKVMNEEQLKEWKKYLKKHGYK